MTLPLLGTVAYRLECSACNVESTGSSLVRDSYCDLKMCRNLERALCTQFLCNTTASAPPRRVSGLLRLRKKGDIKGQLYCISSLHCARRPDCSADWSFNETTTQAF